MWLWTALSSAFLLGFYDVAKKKASERNGVMHILLYTTAISTCFFLPFIFSSLFDWHLAEGTLLEMHRGLFHDHLLIFIKAAIVAVSWITGLMGLKNLPITTAGTIKASRPVFVLIGSIIIFGEHLNTWQWVGVIVSILALWLLSLSSRKEGIDFAKNKWILCMVISVLSGVASALMDKYIMSSMSAIFVQSWCNFYIALIMGVIVLVTRLIQGEKYRKFKWDWAILLISVFVSLSDFFYFFSLGDADAMLSIVSMMRRSSVIITFVCGALLFKERHIKQKSLSLLLLLIGMAILVFGSR